MELWLAAPVSPPFTHLVSLMWAAQPLHTVSLTLERARFTQRVCLILFTSCEIEFSTAGLILEIISYPVQYSCLVSPCAVFKTNPFLLNVSTFLFLFSFCRVDAATRLIQTIFTLKATLALRLASRHFAHSPQPSHQPPSFYTNCRHGNAAAAAPGTAAPPSFFNFFLELMTSSWQQ